MARRTAKQKRKEKKIAFVLVGLLLAAVLAAGMLASPTFALWLQQRLGILQVAGPPDVAKDLAVAVHIIDVGQGDAALLVADGEYALIDAGTPESADVLVAYLHNAGVDSLRYVFMTHPHADHYGGMQRVIERFPVQNVILPDLSLAPYPTAVTFLSLLEEMVAQQLPTETAALGASYPLGGGDITVVHAGLPTQGDYNLLSLGLLFQHGPLRFLATGDGEKENEAAMLDSGFDISAGLLAAGHHGSSTSNTGDFVDAVGPQVVAISCAAGNSYGHPHSGPLKVFGQNTSLILRTDKDGSILVWANDSGGLQYAVTKNRSG